jgi:hypothetical protein
MQAPVKTVVVSEDREIDPEAQAPLVERELSAAELAAVIGGASNIYAPPTKSKGGLDLS